MLYLVECRVKDTEGKTDGGENISLFPDGIEAADRKAAVCCAMEHIIKEARESGRSVTEMKDRAGICRELSVSGEDGETVTYCRFYAKPKKWENYPTPMTQDDRVNAFETEYLQYLLDTGLEAEMSLNGIRVKTGVDTWIIDVRDASEFDAHADIFHKNNWNQNNTSNGRIPGFHRQSSGRFTMEAITDVITAHGGKWKPKNREK